MTEVVVDVAGVAILVIAVSVAALRLSAFNVSKILAAFCILGKEFSMS
jgi:hypothetical protein